MSLLTTHFALADGSLVSFDLPTQDSLLVSSGGLSILITQQVDLPLAGQTELLHNALRLQEASIEARNAASVILDTSPPTHDE